MSKFNIVYDAGDVTTGAIKKKMGMIFIHYSQAPELGGVLWYVCSFNLFKVKLHQAIEYYTYKYYLSESNSFIEPFLK